MTLLETQLCLTWRRTPSTWQSNYALGTLPSPPKWVVISRLIMFKSSGSSMEWKFETQELTITQVLNVEQNFSNWKRTRKVTTISQTICAHPNWILRFKGNVQVEKVKATVSKSELAYRQIVTHNRTVLQGNRHLKQWTRSQFHGTTGNITSTQTTFST